MIGIGWVYLTSGRNVLTSILVTVGCWNLGRVSINDTNWVSNT